MQDPQYIGKMVPKKIPVLGKHREFGNFAKKPTGNLVCSSSKFPDSEDRGLKSVLLMKLSLVA